MSTHNTAQIQPNHAAYKYFVKNGGVNEGSAPFSVSTCSNAFSSFVDRGGKDERLTEIALDVEVLRKGGFSAAEAVADCRLSMFKHRALCVGVCSHEHV